MNRNVVSITLCLVNLATLMQAATPSWDVLPLPSSTQQITDPVRSLNGTWKFHLSPPHHFWLPSQADTDWSEIQVPGEPAMQGHPVAYDQPMAYRRELTIPPEFAGQRLFLRFEGVYSYAQVWINGRYLREHYGGFTSWDCEITDHVTPGKTALLALIVVDREDDISYASGYAKHPIGGILRDVYLYCLPQNYIRGFDLDTHLDNNFQNASLEIDTELSTSDPAEMTISLQDPKGKPVAIIPNTIRFAGQQKKKKASIPIHQPQLWDAEHPHLYTLTATLKTDGMTTETIVQKIGFRRVEIQGNRILVNGRQVHLRGANRHDIHPTLGRTTDRTLDLQDAQLAKEANLNYIRTSHYPPSKAFLEYCDQIGLYVEEETAVCFQYESRPYKSQHKQEYAHRYLSQLTEMIDRDRNHPCVIIWSIGNENHFGVNFQKSYDLVKALDPYRPVMYSFPLTAKDHSCYDIMSLHYPTYQGNRGGGHNPTIKDFKFLDMPAIADEWAHVACYNNDFDIKRDPTVREVWGESMRAMWENAFVSNGTAGGAIWGMIDETFQLPDHCVGYGEWGFIDIWRRKKPEFWLTKKAHSPIRINEQTVLSVSPDQSISIPVKNWFDHTDFNELDIQWRVGARKGSLELSLAPGEEGAMTIPAGSHAADHVHLRFYGCFTGKPQLIDEFKLPLRRKTGEKFVPAKHAPDLRETDSEITVKGPTFRIVFDKQSGQIKQGLYLDKPLLRGGPSLNLAPYLLEPFVLQEIDAQSRHDKVEIEIAGRHGSIDVAYTIRIDGNGALALDYTIANPPSNAQAYHEVGVSFGINDDIDTLQWERNGFYTVYPSNHIGRNRGTATKQSMGRTGAYRQAPTWHWPEDMFDFFYIGKDHQGYGMSHDFRSTKTNLYQAVATNSQTGMGLGINSDGQSHALRLGYATFESVIDDRDARLIYHGHWQDYQDGGNYFGSERYAGSKGDTVEFSFRGTSIAWIGVKNTNCGIVDIYLDDELVKKGLNLYANQKQHRTTLFQQSDLSDTKHTLRIVCTGEKDKKATNSYVVVDGFLHPHEKPKKQPFQMFINRLWAYNLGWGNLSRTSKIESGFRDTIHLRFVEHTDSD